jgi:penicillin-binding protein 1C
VDIVSAKRSPGSTLKPFVYGLALDQGLIHPKTLLKDIPKRFAGYTPENFDVKFAGPIDATKALTTSRNVPAVDLANRLTKPDLYEALKSVYVSKMKPRGHYGLSLPLGGLDMTMLELGQLYMALANDGAWQPVELLAGQNRNQPSSEISVRLMSKEAALLVLHMLEQNPAPGQIRTPGMVVNRQPVGWKTGTSFAFRDAWAAGISGNYTLIIWVGNFNGEGNPNFVGRQAAGPLFFNMMGDLNSRQSFNPDQSIDELLAANDDLNLAKVEICQATGALPEQYCPSTVDSWFIPGVSPIKTANVFQEIPVNLKTGKQACSHEEGITRLSIYEFWPSDVVSMYRMAGIHKRQAPKIESQCEMVTFGSPPRIASPTRGVSYHVRTSIHGSNQIPLKVHLDSNVERGFWFVNQAYLGQTARDEVLYWQAAPGRYELQVVDSRGGSDSMELRVQAQQ